MKIQRFNIYDYVNTFSTFLTVMWLVCAVFYKDCFLMADIIIRREIYNILLVVVCDYIIGLSSHYLTRKVLHIDPLFLNVVGGCGSQTRKIGPPTSSRIGIASK